MKRQTYTPEIKEPAVHSVSGMLISTSVKSAVSGWTVNAVMSA
ncbi:hypothetical protein [Psychrobacter maritimus]|jgi:hypothetical protein